MDFDFSDAENIPYMPEKVDSTANDLIFATGYFTNAYCRQNPEVAIYKTWENFKLFFDKEQHTWRKTTLFYAGDYLPSSRDLEEKPVDNTAKALNLLAAATASDCNNYLHLASAIAYPTTEL